MLSNRPLPTDINVARAVITSPWMQPELISGERSLLNGAMIISKVSYLDFYLIPMIQKTLGADNLAYENLKYTFSDKKSSKGKFDATIYDVHYDNETSWEVSLKILPGTNTIEVEGFINTKLYVDLVTLSNDVGHLHIKGYNHLSGKIMLRGDTPMNENRQPEPEKFSIQIDADINFKGAEIKEDDVAGLLALSNTLESIFKAIGIVGETSAEKIKKSQAETVKLISDTLESRLRNLKIDMNNHAFIPPGGGVFSYQNPHFSNTGNLYIDAIYHSA
jgi:hypothetical protein